MKVLVSLPQPGASLRRGGLRNGVEREQEVLHELFDRGRGRRRLVALKTCQGALAVLIREVQLGEPDRNHRGGNERHDDGGVFPDQPSMRYR